MTTTVTALEIHRLLDEAFTGIDVTPEAQDLKEEIRANLVARVAEFESAGVAPAEAARRAMAELGDIRSVVDETEAVSGAAPPWVRHRVRPRPRYVVRTVVASLAITGALALVALPFFGIAVSLVAQLLAVAVVAALGGLVVADALRQETTTNYPLPPGRAAGFGAATGLTLAGAGVGGLWLRGLATPWLIVAALLVAFAIVGFASLAATQTNRHKPWVVRLQANHEELGDGFTADPAAAARFGLYTVTIWLTALAAFAVLSFTVGWAWSWLALVAAVVAMLVTLARMLFGAKAPHSAGA